MITLEDGREVLNMCANNYLGLANHPEVVEAARKSLGNWGFGTASVRFICGSQSLHRELEEAITAFLGTEDTILYPSCFDANGGLYETLLTSDDAVISDSLNHASIIDGVRLCKARRYRYRNNDLPDLEMQGRPNALRDEPGIPRQCVPDSRANRAESGKTDSNYALYVDHP